MSDYDGPLCDFPCAVCDPQYFDENGDELPIEVRLRMLEGEDE